MTTIIAQKKQLVADRRQVVNAVKAGIVGIRNESKIHKLPYCLYGTAGFVINEKVGGYSKTLFDANLAALCALTYICEKEKQKDTMFLEQTGWSKKDYTNFQGRIDGMRGVVGLEFARDLTRNSQSIVVMTHYNTMIVSDVFTTALNDEVVVLGSGMEMTHVLLDHGVPYEEIYPALRSSGIPTGSTFEMLTLEKDLPHLFPPLSDYRLHAIISVMVDNKLRRQVKNNLLQKETEARARYVLVEDLATLSMLGKVKEKRWYFNKNAVGNWSDINTVMKHRVKLESMCKLVKVKFEDYLEARKESKNEYCF